jgi:hypothetical protein
MLLRNHGFTIPEGNKATWKNKRIQYMSNNSIHHEKQFTMKAIRLGLFLLLILGLAAGCKKDAPLSTQTGNDLKTVSTTSGGNSVVLYAGQTINVGTVSFDDIDTDNNGYDDALEITYSLIDGWEFVEIHFFIGGTLAQLPANKSGNPKVGQFPYNFYPTGQTTFTFTVPFSAINYSCPGGEGTFYVAAHAAVRHPNGNGYQNETGWGDGQRLTQKGNWAMYFTIDITCDYTEPPASKFTQIAYAYMDSVLSLKFQDYNQTYDLSLSSDVWGWTNGPFTPGFYTFELWAGVTNYDFNNGTLVGTVTLDYTGSTATVTYYVTYPYFLESVQLYVGSDLFYYLNSSDPDNAGYTIKPSSQPYVFDDLNAAQSYTVTVENLSGPIYMNAHAVISEATVSK